jgi:hypothetical protein
MRKIVITLALLASSPVVAQAVNEDIGPWRLACTTDRMTDRTACTLRHREPVERSAIGPALLLEIIERNGQLVPAVTARDLSFDSAARGLLAITGAAQIRFDRNAMMELPCGLEGRSLVCAPRSGDAARAATELLAAERVLARMSGFGSNTSAATEPTELRLADTRQATERLRRYQPAGSTPPPAAPGFDMRDLMGRVQRLIQ